MFSALNTFYFGETPIRVIVDDHGKPWWIATEIGSILDLKGNGFEIARVLDADEKGAITIRTPGGPQEVTAVTESGLYALIFRSRKPEAKRFRKWVTSEVLPNIRKTGSYRVPGKGTAKVKVSLTASLTRDFMRVFGIEGTREVLQRMDPATFANLPGMMPRNPQEVVTRPLGLEEHLPVHLHLAVTR